MPRYKAIIAYDGTNFNGFQSQINGRTVQDELEKTLYKLNNNQSITIFGSGRTDAGVHALGQVIHFDYLKARDVEKLRFALDTQSPADISVKKIEEVSNNFHARYHVIEKTYQFKIDTGKTRDPFRRFYASYFPHSIDLAKIEKALPDLLGEHDFTSFCAAGCSVDSKIRTIYEASVSQTSEDEIIFTFRGNGFLYKMVRIIVGTLLKIGQGKIKETAIPEIIAGKNRRLAGPTAHPEGLYLVQVIYEENSMKTIQNR
ncbi:tRNA pseudouridine(38-40) synthase TruA [Melissococcus plutonius]|uniref:tRNA pseudouridine synthase A n=1 Tax=Melissococcus plutonius (strain ATCC 35311 / DSM 29964 / CIP 104052 / LMG 20360 / NCIMB 702443) TaxID=940190 RepID=F3Y832_MELPT|nr:tRNA pseudouridine(38-40) synthase TruA [Melissococcus plutonius]AIM24410.1 tRNA pseudouridine synthase A [Melissococcus plutonius S1]KMT25803.1 tRNA pseudouridine synthase A [Melissococcus plutonius]KMT27148.1 tRNA pseudouridine synthase A [Melissococcus plutonius]KMT28249.1 tRNA pseudouridine synthase A [Melissococcus plutonius]KMT29986.1 tRNA pseudouridine synthase A [Melissococcus plutonius]